MRGARSRDPRGAPGRHELLDAVDRIDGPAVAAVVLDGLLGVAVAAAAREVAVVVGALAAPRAHVVDKRRQRQPVDGLAVEAEVAITLEDPLARVTPVRSVAALGGRAALLDVGTALARQLGRLAGCAVALTPGREPGAPSIAAGVGRSSRQGKRLRQPCGRRLPRVEW